MIDIAFKVLKIKVDWKISEKRIPQARSAREETINTEFMITSSNFSCDDT